MTNTIIEPTQKFESAVFVGNAVNGSAEWHELRKRGLGGSDIAAICKVSPWGSPWSVWAKKTGLLSDESGSSEAMEWGTRLESVILDKFCEEHPDLTLMSDFGTWAHCERRWQLANPDAVYQHDDGSRGIIEVKTARYEDDWANGVPAYYRTQVIWYLQTFGLKHAYVVVLFGGSKYREFEIDYNEFEADANLAEAEKMWALIESNTQPDYDGMMATYETIRQIHPDIDPEGELELGDLFTAYQDAVSALDGVTGVVNSLKSAILDSMGTAKKGLFNGKWVVTRQAKNGGTPYLVSKKG